MASSMALADQILKELYKPRITEWLNEIPEWVREETEVKLSEVPPIQIIYPTTLDEMAEMLWQVEQWTWGTQVIAIDTETNSADELWTTGRGFCRLFQIGTKEKVYVVDAQGWHNVVAEVCKMVRDSHKRVTFANFKYDLRVMEKEGWAVPDLSNIEDVLISHRIYRSDQRRHGLKIAAENEFGRWARYGKQEFDKAVAAGKWNWNTVPIDLPEFVQYAGFDVSLTARLQEVMRERCSQWYDIEVAYCGITYGMETKGMLIDIDAAHRLHHKYTVKIQELADRLATAGIEKPGSNKSIEKALTAMGFEPTELTDSGNTKLDKLVLGKLVNGGGLMAEVAADLIEYRRVTKWRTVYCEKLINAADKQWYVHPSILTQGAITGRSSVTNPPLQTIPKRAEVRNLFLAEPGHELWTIDYSSQEARILAYMSQEPSLMAVFKEGGSGDIHQVIADALDIDRNTAKTVVYAKVFGAGNATLGAAVGGGAETGASISSLFKANFPRLDRWFQGVISQGEQTAASRADGQGGAMVPGSGRNIFCPGEECYKLINYLIQGYGSDVLKRAVVRLWQQGLAQYIRMVVHDEVVFQFPAGKGAELAVQCASIMEEELGRGITLTCDISGPYKRWGKKYEEKE